MMVELLAAAELSSADVTDIENAFQALELAPVTRIAPTHRGMEHAWLVLAALPAHTFFEALVQQAGHDAYKALHALAERVLGRVARRAGPPRSLILESTESGARIILEADLPSDAYRRLFEQLSDERLDGVDQQLRYDRRRKRWSDSSG